MPHLPRWSETTAVFGGRFDPPHLGHTEAVRGLFRMPGVKRVWIVPSPTPPHKAATAEFEHRLEMAKLALLGSHPERDTSAVTLDLREAERARLQPHQPTYSFDTLQEMRREVSNLAFVIGTDQLEQLHTWHRFPDLLVLCHWIVLARKPGGMERALTVLTEWEGSGLAQKAASSLSGLVQWRLNKSSPAAECYLAVVPTDAAEVSSTRIREQIAKTGEPPEGAVSPEVLAYLKQNRLYGIRSPRNYD